MSNPDRFYSCMSPFIDRYLRLKQALGREYRAERDTFCALDRFLLESDPEEPDLTLQSFADWSHALCHLTSGVRRNKMRIVRNLCLYRRRTDPDCFVPDLSQFPPPHQPVRPYIFSESEITRLIDATASFDPTPGSPLRPEVFRLATVLLYTTGLRRGELVRLTLGDYDPRERTLLVRQSKFHKSRLLPLSDDTAIEIESYLAFRRACGLPSGSDTALLWNRHRRGNPYTGTGLGQGFRLLFDVTRIRTPVGRAPRVHDFRHSFAVNALLRWYRGGIDVQTRLPALATYMGHVSIVSTQYYLRFIDEIAGCAAERFAHLCAGLITVSGGGQ